MFATTATRSQGSERIVRAIEDETRARLRRLAGRPRAIESRLRDLDEEWDIERAIQANAATLVLAGSALAIGVDRRWSWLPLAVSTFLLQHATQGWCPPVPVLRSLGFRTQVEIERERHALKAMRGDFETVTPGRPSARRRQAEEAFMAAERDGG